ncbi:MAG: ATP synthase F0 subunit C [Anaerolineales bacterium]|jgi:ATP synthase F0 subunit c
MTAEVALILIRGLRFLGAGLAMTGAIGAGLGVGLIGYGALQGMARNPEATGMLQTNMILAIALCEAIAIYALVAALLILFV